MCVLDYAFAHSHFLVCINDGNCRNYSSHFSERHHFIFRNSWRLLFLVDVCTAWDADVKKICSSQWDSTLCVHLCPFVYGNTYINIWLSKCLFVCTLGCLKHTHLKSPVFLHLMILHIICHIYLKIRSKLFPKYHLKSGGVTL